jgi:hypothetical protein
VGGTLKGRTITGARRFFIFAEKRKRGAGGGGRGRKEGGGVGLKLAVYFDICIEVVMVGGVCGGRRRRLRRRAT